MHRKRRENPGASCPKVKDKELAAMIAAAWRAGWWCEKRSGTGHVMCYSPVAGGKAVLVANTPSDHRTVLNTRASLRRAGLDI